MKLLELANKLNELNKETIKDLDEMWVIIYSGGHKWSIYGLLYAFGQFWTFFPKTF